MSEKKAAKLAQLIVKLGYSKRDADDLSQEVEWLFDMPTLVPVVDWLSSNLDENNALSTLDLEKFKEIERHNHVLEGAQLEEALQRIQIQSSSRESDKELTSQIAILESQIERVTKTTHRQITQRDKLLHHYSQRSKYLSKLDELEEEKIQSLQSSHRRVLESGEDFNDRLHKLHRVAQLSIRVLVPSSSSYSPTTGSSSSHSLTEADQKNDIPLLLSQADRVLSNYLAADEAFIRTLTRYFRVQFEEGIAGRVADTISQSSSMYNILDIQVPQQVLLEGDSEQRHETRCKELTRLQMAHPAAERSRLKALMTVSRLKSACTEIENQIRGDTQAMYLDISKERLQEKIKKAQDMLTTVNSQLADLTQDKFPILFDELSSLTLTPILEGDYSMKLARQEYYLQRQADVVGALIRQHARNQMILNALRVEYERHQHEHNILQALTLELEQLLNTAERRLEKYIRTDRRQQASQGVGSRQIVDDRDRYLRRLHKLLSISVGDPPSSPSSSSPSSSLSLSRDHIIQDALQLKQEQSDTRKSFDDALTEWQHRREKIDSEVQNLGELLHVKRKTSLLTATLTNPQLSGAFNKAHQNLAQCQQYVTKSKQEYQSAIKSHHQQYGANLSTIRSVFTNFHLHPEQLSQLSEKLKERIAAQSLHFN